MELSEPMVSDVEYMKAYSRARESGLSVRFISDGKMFIVDSDGEYEAEEPFGDDPGTDLIEEPRDVSLTSIAPTPSAHNFTGSKRRVWALIERAKNGDCISGEDAIDAEIKIEHIFQHIVNIESSDGGGKVDVVRTVLVTDDGTQYGFSSRGIAESAMGIRQLYSNGRIDPPLRVRISSRPTSGKKRFYTLSPTEIPEE